MVWHPPLCAVVIWGQFDAAAPLHRGPQGLRGTVPTVSTCFDRCHKVVQSTMECAAGVRGLAEIVDDLEAYRAVLAAIRGLDPERAEVFRRTTRWTPKRQLREPLNKAPLHVLEAIEKALAALPLGPNARRP